MRRPLAFFCAAVFIVVFLLNALGILLFKRSRDLPADGEMVTVEGCAVKITGKYIMFKGDLRPGTTGPGRENPENERNPAEEYSVEGYQGVTLLVTFADDNEYVSLGEKIVLSGRIRHFSHAMNPGQFDAESYYTSKGADAFLMDAVIGNREGGRYPVREGLRRLRAALEERLYAVCPQKEASILCDLLLGDKEGIDEKTEELYKNNGIAHILSISGLHISILGMGLFRLLRKGGVRQIPAAMVSAFVLVLYGLMTGMSVSATRAIGMFLIRMLAYPAKRTPDPVTSLMFMAAVVSIVNPGNVTSAGFLLSYGAAFGMIVFLPAFEAAASSEPEKHRPAKRPSLKDVVCRSLRASIAITLFTLPVQLYFFYKVSPWCIFLNLLILPCMSLLVFCAMISLIPGLGICASVSCILLDMFEILCRGAQSLPFHAYCPGRPGAGTIILYYACILIITLYGNLIIAVRKRGLSEYRIYFDKKGVAELSKLEELVRKMDSTVRIIDAVKQDGVRRGMDINNGIPSHDHISGIGPCIRPASLCLITAVAIMLVLTEFPLPAKNTSTQLYIGQGNCNVTVTDSGEVYMFDGGSSSEKNAGEYIILPYLRYSGLCSVDAVFISHSDTDHISGVLELLENAEDWGVSVDALYITPQMKEDGTENTENLLRACMAAGVSVHTISAGSEWNSGKMHFTCLHPAKDYIPEDPNSGSMCILAELGDRSILFPGDVQGSGEDALTKALEEMSEKSRRLDVYITAHHGSTGTTSNDFLDAARPRLAINSAGLNNRYGHPAPETLARFRSHGTLYLTTYETGAVRISLKGKKIEFITFEPY